MLAQAGPSVCNLLFDLFIPLFVLHSASQSATCRVRVTRSGQVLVPLLILLL